MGTPPTPQTDSRERVADLQRPAAGDVRPDPAPTRDAEPANETPPKTTEHSEPADQTPPETTEPAEELVPALPEGPTRFGDEDSLGGAGSDDADGGEGQAGSFGVDIAAEREIAVVFGGFWELARNIDRIERERVDADADAGDDVDGAGPDGAGAVASGDDESDVEGPGEAPAAAGEFWDLAKKGLAAWGHEPSVEEMVDYWRGLIDDIRTAEHDEAIGELPAIAIASAPPPSAATTSPQGSTTEGEEEAEDEAVASRSVPAPPQAPSGPPESAWSPARAARPASPQPGFLDRRRTAYRPANQPAGPLVALGGDPAIWVRVDGPRIPAEAIHLDVTLEADTIDLEDTIELDELVELAGLADMAVLTDPTNVPHASDHTTSSPGPDTEPSGEPAITTAPDMPIGRTPVDAASASATTSPPDQVPPDATAPPEQATATQFDHPTDSNPDAIDTVKLSNDTTADSTTSSAPSATTEDTDVEPGSVMAPSVSTARPGDTAATDKATSRSTDSDPDAAAKSVQPGTATADGGTLTTTGTARPGNGARSDVPTSMATRDPANGKRNIQPPEHLSALMQSEEDQGERPTATTGTAEPGNGAETDKPTDMATGVPTDGKRNMQGEEERGKGPTATTRTARPENGAETDKPTGVATGGPADGGRDGQGEEERGEGSTATSGTAGPGNGARTDVGNGVATGGPADGGWGTRGEGSAGATTGGGALMGDEGPGRPWGLAGGGLAFAGGMALVDRRRRAQQRHRPSGRQIAMPAVPLDAYERELRHGADHAMAALVDTALRAAAAGAPDGSLPPLRWVEASPDGVTLVLDAARPAPPGFTLTGETAWATSATLDDLAARAAPALPPIRALIPLGAAREGRDGHELLIDLESTGMVTVDGPPDDVRGLLRAAAVALATAPWSDLLQVIVVGLDPELEALPGIRAVDDLDAALTLAEAHVTRLDSQGPPVGGTPDGDGSTAALPPGVRPNPPDDGGRHESGNRPDGEGAELRPSRPAVRAWPQEDVGESLVVVSAVAAEDRADQERISALGRRSRRGLGLLLRQPSESLTDDSDARRLSIDGDGRLRGEGIEEVVSARRLDEVETTALAALLDIARRDAHGPVLGRALEVRRPTPVVERSPTVADEQGIHVLDELLAEVDVLVRVLGEVEAVRLGARGAAPPGALTEARADVGSRAGGDADDRLAVLRAPHDGDDRTAARIQVQGGEMLEPPSAQALEVVTFLALSASPVSYGSLQVNLCVEGGDAGTVDEAIGAARRFLGDDLLPAPTRGRYTLSERVVTDYGVLGALLVRAEATEADGDPEAATRMLAAAVELVRGPALSGPGHGYAWAGPQRETMVARVVDLAERLAERRLAADDWDGAEAAARQGLKALPCDERLHRALMRSAHGRGDIDLVHQVFEELCDAIADPDTGVEPDDTLHPETVELLERLVARRPRQPDRYPEVAGDLASDRTGDSDHLAA